LGTQNHITKGETITNLKSSTINMCDVTGLLYFKSIKESTDVTCMHWNDFAIYSTDLYWAHLMKSSKWPLAASYWWRSSNMDVPLELPQSYTTTVLPHSSKIYIFVPPKAPLPIERPV